jgi:hypothetical protein
MEISMIMTQIFNVSLCFCSSEYRQTLILDQNDQMTNKINKTRSLLTSALNHHLNLGQHFLINTSEVLMAFEKISSQSLSKKQFGNDLIFIPENLSFHFNETVLTRVCFLFWNFVK